MSSSGICLEEKRFSSENTTVGSRDSYIFCYKGFNNIQIGHKYVKFWKYDALIFSLNNFGDDQKQPYMASTITKLGNWIKIIGFVEKASYWLTATNFWDIV